MSDSNDCQYQPVSKTHHTKGVVLVSGADWPRNVMWRGGAVHLHLGGGSHVDHDLHAHFAIQVSISLQRPISFRSSRFARKHLSDGWLIASDQPHLMQGEGAELTIVLDPLSFNGRRLAARLGDAGALALSPAESKRVRKEFESGLAVGWSGETVRAAADRVIRLLSPASINPRGLDPRVQSVVNDLNLDSSENVRLQDLAAKVGLSESRLAHLFRRDVGIPMRQYRLSLRTQEAVAQISNGRSLTDSAHIAGFADSAHFCRICRRMFGSSPSDLPNFEVQKSAL